MIDSFGPGTSRVPGDLSVPLSSITVVSPMLVQFKHQKYLADIFKDAVLSINDKLFSYDFNSPTELQHKLPINSPVINLKIVSIFTNAGWDVGYTTCGNMVTFSFSVSRDKNYGRDITAEELESFCK